MEKKKIILLKKIRKVYKENPDYINKNKDAIMTV